MYYDRLLALLARRFGEPLRAPTSLIASGIPIGRPPRIVGDRVLLVGDAAAQVKPLSGGGIFTGMRAAELAAAVAARALGEGDASARRLEGPARVRRRARGGVPRALYLRRVFTRLSDAELDALVDVLRTASSGGRSSPSATSTSRRTWPQLLESPSLLRLLPKALGAFPSLSVAAWPTPELEPGPRGSRARRRAHELNQ